MLTTDETRFVKKYAMYPRIMAGAFVSMVTTGLAAVVADCVMIGIINYPRTKAHEIVESISIGMMMLMGIVGIICFTAMRINTKKQDYNNLDDGSFHKFDVKNHRREFEVASGAAATGRLMKRYGNSNVKKMGDVASGISTAAGAYTLYSISKDSLQESDEMAERYEIEVPEKKTVIKRMVLVPIIIIIALNIYCSFGMRQVRSAEKAAIEKVEDGIYNVLLTYNPDDVYKSDVNPYDSLDNYVHGTWNERTNEEYELWFTVDKKNHVIDALQMDFEFDASLSNEENYGLLEERFAQGQMIIKQVHEPYKSRDLVNGFVLPDDFYEAFLNMADGKYDFDYTDDVTGNVELEHGTNYEDIPYIKVRIVVYDFSRDDSSVVLNTSTIENTDNAAATGTPKLDTQKLLPEGEKIVASPNVKDTDNFYAIEFSEDSEIFERIKGNSYKDNCTVPVSDLRYLHVLHVGFDGETHEGEIICNKYIADDLLEIFEELYEADYPIEKIRLVDEYAADDELSMADNNSSSFNFRFISHTTKISKHGYGLAMDINTLYNPYVKTVNGNLSIEPANAAAYVDRSQDFDYKIDENDLAYKLFIAHGFEWGGSWKNSKDYQHFEVPDSVVKQLY